MKDLLSHFSDPDAIAKYAEGPPRFMPGYESVQRMTSVLLAEQTPTNAHVLVLGAGGGLELKVFAEAHPGWTFDGVDPAAQMLDQAVQTMGAHAHRANMHVGYIEDAPSGPYDAATCLLTLHFLDADERLRTLKEIHRRLKPGAPFVAAHSSFPQESDQRDLWLSRYAAFALASGADPTQVKQAHETVKAHLNMLNPEHDEALMREAGFKNISLFYAAFTWRGWVMYA